MKILAIDQGTLTGWAIAKDRKLLDSGVQSFELRRGESIGTKYMRFRMWLHGILDLGNFNLVVFEQAHHRGGASTEAAIAFTTRILEECAVSGIEHCSVHSATLKKFAVGRGNAKKPDMIAAARKKWVLANPVDDNEADALLLLAYAMENYA